MTVLFQLLNGNQKPSEQALTIRRDLVSQAATNLPVSSAAINSGLNNVGSQAHKYPLVPGSGSRQLVRR